MVLVLRRNYLAAASVLILALAGGFLLLWSRMGGESVAALSWVLVDRVIAVDPGHGGIDPGAIGPGGTLEKDITLAISHRLRKMLSQGGATVVMTRETDTDLGSSGKSIGARKREDLSRRVDLARRQGAEVYLSIQANAFGSRWTGAQTFYNPKSDAGKRLAEAVQKELRDILGNTNRQAKPLDVYILRNLPMAAVIIEVGFLSNAGEEKLLKDPYYQEKVALAIYSGTVRYLAEME